MKYLTLFIFLLFAINLYSQSYLIKELKGDIWVTSRVEITNSAQTNEEPENNKEKEPIKVNNKIGIVKIIPVLKYVPQEILTPF